MEKGRKNIEKGDNWKEQRSNSRKVEREEEHTDMSYVDNSCCSQLDRYLDSPTSFVPSSGP